MEDRERVSEYIQLRCMYSSSVLVEPFPAHVSDKVRELVIGLGVYLSCICIITPSQGTQLCL